MGNAGDSKKTVKQGSIPKLRSARVILSLGLVMTALAVMYTKSNVDKIAWQVFNSDCNEVKERIAGRLADHARVLISAAALFDASESVTREEWRIYSERQKLELELPGLQGIGFSLLIPGDQLARHIQQIRSEGFPEYQVKPPGDRKTYSSIIYIEPFSGRNIRAFGYDMFSEPTRRAAMELAMDTDRAVLSGKVVLVQETGSEIQAGTLMFVPVYRKGMPVSTVEQRRAAIYGWVYSPYRMNDLIQGILFSSSTPKEKLPDFRIYDGEQLSASSLLYEYRSSPFDGTGRPPRFTMQTPIDSNGHRWTMNFTMDAISIFSAKYIPVWLTLATGLFITLLLHSLFNSLFIRAETQRLSEQDYRTLADSGQALIWQSGVDTLCDYFNQVWLDFTGRTFEHEFGNGWQEGIHPDDLQRCLKIYMSALEKREAFSRDYRLLRHDGVYCWIQDDGCPRYDVNGKFAGYIGYCLNITDRKLAEKTLNEKNTELERFTYTVSHDLKSPLITIQTYAGMILNGMEKDSYTTARSDLKRIERAASKMTALLNDLLELSRIGRQINAPLRIDMNLLVNEVLGQLAGPLGSQVIKVTVSQDLPGINGDHKRIAEVFQNLVENAIKYMGDQNEPCIEIGTRQDGKETVFFVKDNGIGIDPRFHKNVFGLFNKLDAGSEGTGVGLALVNRIIEAHEGRVWVESEGAGKGSSFCFTLPTVVRGTYE